MYEHNLQSCLLSLNPSPLPHATICPLTPVTPYPVRLVSLTFFSATIVEDKASTRLMNDVAGGRYPVTMPFVASIQARLLEHGMGHGFHGH